MKRFLLLVVVAAAFAGAFVSRASALAFDDSVCPGDVLRVCPQGVTSTPYSVQLKGRDGTGCVPYVTFSTKGELPPGLSLSSSGLISGVPKAEGIYDFYVDMTDIPASQGGVFWCADNKTTSRLFEIRIVQGLSIQQQSLKPTVVNQPYSSQLTATGGGSQTWSVASGTLPPGITLSTAGLLSGTPTTTGSYTFVVKVADVSNSRSDTETLTIKVVQPLVAQVPAAIPASEVAKAFALTPTATGGTAPYTWTLTGTLPDGLTFDAATGAIAGTPTTAGAASITLTLTDADGFTATLPVTIDVKAKLAISTTRLPAARVGRKYARRLVATGGVVPRTWRLIHGPLPRGIRFDTTRGMLVGTPRKKGTFQVTVRVRDALGAISTTTVSITVRR